MSGETINEKSHVILPADMEPKYGGGVKGHKNMLIHQQLHVQTIGALAIELASKWGMVAAIPDGEDSEGRQKMRLQTPEEVAARACDTASLLWEQLTKREWLLDLGLPQPDPNYKAAKEKVFDDEDDA